jgi:hypothetical protein
VEAVVGFEKGGSGRSHPTISGVIVLKKFEKQVKAEIKKIKDLEKQRKAARIIKSGKAIWKQLIKAIVTKKYISTTYDH